MLTVTTSGGFGQSAADQALIPGLITRGQSLATAETSLRNTFGRYFLILTAFKDAGKQAPEALKSMMRRYNTAQVAYTEAANFWLIARAGTPRDQLPDPDKEPETVPAFDPADLATNGFGGSTFNPGSIGIIFGPVGKTQRVSLGEYAPYHYVSGNGLGIGFIPVAIFVILAMAITGWVITSLFGKSQAAADIAANQAATAKALARQAEVESDERTLQNLLAACIGTNVNDADIRFKCAQIALEKLPDIQAGRPDTNVPGTTKSNVFTVIGILAVLGVAGTAGYLLYRRRKQHVPQLVRSRQAHSASDAEIDY
jgi:LPXTG-motif cell wall-anchored protein